MKYSQFIELEETLAEKGHTVKEFQTALNEGLNDDKLYEFFGINKALLSWGVKGIMSKRLKKQAEIFKADAGETSKDAVRKLMNSKNKLSEQIKAIQKADKPVPQKAWDQIGTIEKRIIKIANEISKPKNLRVIKGTNIVFQTLMTPIYSLLKKIT